MLEKLPCVPVIENKTSKDRFRSSQFQIYGVSIPLTAGPETAQKPPRGVGLLKTVKFRFVPLLLAANLSTGCCHKLCSQCRLLNNDFLGHVRH